MKYFLLISFLALALTQDTTGETQLSVLGDTCTKGDDTSCNPDGTGNCCMYSRLESVETWYCAVRPTEAEIKAAEEAEEAAEKLAKELGIDVPEIDAESYCDNAILTKVSFIVVALVALFAF